MCRPLRDIAAINGRLDAVQELIERPELVVPLRSALQGEHLSDMLRLACQVLRHATRVQGSAQPPRLLQEGLRWCEQCYALCEQCYDLAAWV